MKAFLSICIGLLLPTYAFTQSREASILAEIDAINEMPLWVAYLVPLDSLGEVVSDEFVDFSQVYSYKLLDDSQIENAFPLFTVYFDEKDRVRKAFKRWTDGGALHSIAYYDSNGQLVYGAYNKDVETYGRVYADTFRSGLSVEMFPSTECIEKQYGVALQKPRNAQKIRFVPQPGDDAVLCSSHVYSSPNGKKSAKGEDGIYIYFGMPVIVSALAGDWCKITSIFHAPIGYAPIRNVEIIK